MASKSIILTAVSFVAIIVVGVASAHSGSFQRKWISGIQIATVSGNATPTSDVPTVTIDLIYVLIAIAAGIFAILGIKISDIIKGLSWRRKYGKAEPPL